MTVLTGAWSDLHFLFLRADDLSVAEFVAATSKLQLPTALIRGLQEAIQGDTRSLASHLFATSPMQEDPVAFLAPINIQGQKRNAWMIGCIPGSLPNIRRRFDDVRELVRTDPLLVNEASPPPVLFIEPVAVSSVQSLAIEGTQGAVDDFAIFRAGKPMEEEGDVDQRLLLDCAAIRKNLEVAYKVGDTFFPGSLAQVSDILQEDVELLGMLHAEGHNRGHFAGPWSFDKHKSGLMHEAVEEFRACLCAVQWSEHLDLSELQRHALAVSIFLTRFFYYGLRAYQREVKTRQSIREISVALMFFETLRQAGAIRETAGHRLQLDVEAVRPALWRALINLHDQEREAKRVGPEQLRTVARSWYQLAYPGGSLSLAARQIYERR